MSLQIPHGLLILCGIYTIFTRENIINYGSRANQRKIMIARHFDKKKSILKSSDVASINLTRKNNRYY